MLLLVGMISFGSLGVAVLAALAAKWHTVLGVLSLGWLLNVVVSLVVAKVRRSPRAQ